MPKEGPYGFSRSMINRHVVLPTGTGAATLCAAVALGFRGRIKAARYIADVAATGAGASRTLRLLKNGSVVVGTATVVLADVDEVGEVKAITIDRALNDFTDTDTLTVDIASGGTAFTAGAGNIEIEFLHRPQAYD